MSFLMVSASQVPADTMKIAFYSSRDFGDFRDFRYNIYVMNVDGTNSIRLTKSSASDTGPTWSPDGKRIAFTSNPNGVYDIYVMRANGSKPINLTENQDGRNRGTAWQPLPLAVSPQEKLVTLWGTLKTKQ
jgi:Tol biopolymer transport system component